MTEETALVVCLSVAGNPEPPAPSEQVVCHLCKAEVWISKTLYPEVATGALEPTCVECVTGVLETTDDMTMAVHPRQRGELRRLGVEQLADHLAKDHNDRRRRP